MDVELLKHRNEILLLKNRFNYYDVSDDKDQPIYKQWAKDIGVVYDVHKKVNDILYYLIYIDSPFTYGIKFKKPDNFDILISLLNLEISHSALLLEFMYDELSDLYIDILIENIDVSRDLIDIITSDYFLINAPSYIYVDKELIYHNLH